MAEPFLVKDINPGSGSGSSFPRDLTAFGDTLYFSAGDFDGYYFGVPYGGDKGRELWKSDGSEDGTVLVKDINPGSGSPYLRNLTSVGETLYFTADDDGVNGSELWKSDGSEDGTPSWSRTSGQAISAQILVH